MNSSNAGYDWRVRPSSRRVRRRTNGVLCGYVTDRASPPRPARAEVDVPRRCRRPICTRGRQLAGYALLQPSPAHPVEALLNVPSRNWRIICPDLSRVGPRVHLDPMLGALGQEVTEASPLELGQVRTELNRALNIVVGYRDMMKKRHAIWRDQVLDPFIWASKGKVWGEGTPYPTSSTALYQAEEFWVLRETLKAFDEAREGSTQTVDRIRAALYDLQQTGTVTYDVRRLYSQVRPIVQQVIQNLPEEARQPWGLSGTGVVIALIVAGAIALIAIVSEIAHGGPSSFLEGVSGYVEPRSSQEVQTLMEQYIQSIERLHTQGVPLDKKKITDGLMRMFRETLTPPARKGALEDIMVWGGVLLGVAVLGPPLLKHVLGEVKAFGKKKRTRRPAATPAYETE